MRGFAFALVWEILWFSAKMDNFFGLRLNSDFWPKASFFVPKSKNVKKWYILSMFSASNSGFILWKFNEISTAT